MVLAYLLTNTYSYFMIALDAAWGPVKRSLKRRNLKAMSVTHTDPLANMRMFEDAFSRLVSEPRTGRPWSPAVDIFETENELVLKADIPDVDLKDIEVRVEKPTMTDRRERKFEQ